MSADIPKDQGRWMALAAAFLGWMFDGLEMGLFPLAGRSALRELMSGEIVGQDPDKVVGMWFGRIIALFLVGAGLGGVGFGWLGDRLGRVRAMVLAVLTYSLMSGLCAFVTAPWQLGALRFLASLGMGGEWALGVALVMEVWPSKSRPFMAGLIGAAANVGFLLIGFVGLGLSNFVGVLGQSAEVLLPKEWVQLLLRNDGWRLLFLLGALPAFLTLALSLFVPESEKWKHASTHGPKVRVADIFAPGLASKTFIGLALAALALLGTWGSVQWIPPWAAKMAHSQNAAAWTQICMAAGAIIGSIVVALLAERFTRRASYLGLAIATLVVCQWLFRSSPPYGGTFLWLAFAANGLSAGFYGWLPLYLPELFPTRVRATATGFAFNSGRFIAAGGTLGSGALLASFDGDYPRMAGTISLIYLLGPVIIWFGPETKGRPLPE